MVLRAATILAAVLALVGCGSGLPGDERVPLLTGPPNYAYGHGGCFTFGVTGRLIVDPKYGTAIEDPNGGPTATVAWRPGFTARWTGSQVAVLDPDGNIVAVTGGRYAIDGGYVSRGGSSGLVWPDLPVGVFWACDRVTRWP